MVHKTTAKTLRADDQDAAWQSGTPTTWDDLAQLGNVDQWLRDVEAVSGGSNPAKHDGPDNGNFWDGRTNFIFWINKLTFVDVERKSNEVQEWDFNDTILARMTRTVGDVTVIKGQEIESPPVEEVQTYSNDTDREETDHYTVTQVSGYKSSLTVTHKSEFTASATVNIGEFASMNISGSLTDEQSSRTSKNTTTTTEHEETLQIPAGKRLVFKVSTSTISRTDTYEVKISIRGEHDMASINVPSSHGPINNIGQWVKVRDLPNIGQTMAMKTAIFSVATVTHKTETSRKLTDLESDD